MRKVLLSVFVALSCITLRAQYGKMPFDPQWDLSMINVVNTKSDSEPGCKIFTVAYYDYNLPDALNSKVIMRVFFTKDEYSEVRGAVKRGDDIYIQKVPTVRMIFTFSRMSSEDMLLNTETALWVHHYKMNRYTLIDSYDECDSRRCPVLFRHYPYGSFQMSKKNGKYYLFAGAPMNDGKEVVKWDTNDMNKNRTFEDILIELTPEEAQKLFM